MRRIALDEALEVGRPVSLIDGLSSRSGAAGAVSLEERAPPGKAGASSDLAVAGIRVSCLSKSD